MKFRASLANLVNTYAKNINKRYAVRDHLNREQAEECQLLLEARELNNDMKK